jgi:hypothetical protein
MGEGQDFWEKGKCGVLHNKQTRMAYLADAAYRIRFVYTPAHCSWLNLVEVWFRGLTKRMCLNIFYQMSELRYSIKLSLHTPWPTQD